MSALATEFFRNRTSGRGRIVTTVIRILGGVAFVPSGLLKFADLPLATSGFVAAGYPDTPIFPILVGLLEFFGGAMLLAGLGTRLAALGLAITMVGATIANTITMPPAIPVTVVLFLLMAYLLWAGPGNAAVDNKLAARFVVNSRD